MKSKTLDFQQIGGGGALQVRPDVVDLRIKAYLNKTSSFQKTRTLQAITYVLPAVFGYSNVKIAALLDIHRSTVVRYQSQAEFFYRRQKTFRELCGNIYKYILYNAAYVPLESKAYGKECDSSGQ